MLNSIHIRNYRNLSDIQINSLSKVNLITGKNNSGKSTLLEAVALFVTKCNFNVLIDLLEDRGEIIKQSYNAKNPIDKNLNTLSSMFYNRIIDFKDSNMVHIATTENTLFGDISSSESSISFRFIKYYDELIKNEDNSNSRKRIIIDNDLSELIVDYKVGFEIKVGNNATILSLDDDRFLSRYSYRGFNNIENFQFIRTRNIDRELNGKLWDNITLTDKELLVIEALRIIEPSVERIAFIEDSSRTRSAVIKLSNIPNVLPLKSMGDGINRILTIILALVNADNGFLLIDEFENGLHYSVQEKLWEIIFKIADKLNIQVFATTHSEDCILGFEGVLNKENLSYDGKVLRLNSINNKVEYVEFTKDELKIIGNRDIEIR